MYKSSTINRLWFDINRGGTNIGAIYLEKNSDNSVGVGMAIYQGGSYNYTPCSIKLNSNGVIEIRGSSVTFNGNTKWS